MNPCDTQIDRMAETFAPRTPSLRSNPEDAKTLWRDALAFGREEGTLEQIEDRMREKDVFDAPVQDAWQRARDYGDDGVYDPYANAPTVP